MFVKNMPELCFLEKSISLCNLKKDALKNIMYILSVKPKTFSVKCFKLYIFLLD